MSTNNFLSNDPWVESVWEWSAMG